jgi:carbon monoxide dehydrogenase subunit G
METKKFEISALIANTPEAVIDYVADPRNRPLYFPSLKSITDVKGDPRAVGTSWKWTFATLGMEFQGTGRCLKYEPGKLYSFRTEGGIDSTFTYEARPEGQGTRLTIRLEHGIPEAAKPRLPAESVGEAMKKAEAERVIQNLKAILDR